MRGRDYFCAFTAQLRERQSIKLVVNCHLRLPEIPPAVGNACGLRSGPPPVQVVLQSDTRVTLAELETFVQSKLATVYVGMSEQI